MTGEAGAEHTRGIGARLRAARETRGLTLLQAAEKLHVDAGTLQALEAEDFVALGADVYVRGHLRRYAEAVGESAAELQGLLYAGGTRAPRPDLTRIPRHEPGSSSARLLLPALLVVVGFAVAGLLWWMITLPGGRSSPPAAAAPQPTASTEGSAGVGQVAAPSTAAHAVQAAAGGEPAQASSTASATIGAGQAQLSMTFSGASWVEVSDAGGRRLLQGLIEAGSTRTLTGSAPLRVVLGNAAAVALRVNDQPVSFPGLVHHDGSAHLLIDAAGRASRAAPRLAHED